MGQGIAGPLQEQHRVFHPDKVVGPFPTRFAGGVERETQEDQPLNARKRLFYGRPRGHSTPSDLPPANKGSGEVSSQANRTADRTVVSSKARVGVPFSFLHVRKLVA